MKIILGGRDTKQPEVLEMVGSFLISSTADADSLPTSPELTFTDLSGDEKHNNFNASEWTNETDGISTIPEAGTPLGWADFALVFLFCCIIAGTVIGNTLVIAAVTTTRRLRTVTNCFVMSLAVADWLVGMFVMPLKVGLYLVDNKWHLGRILCELWISLDILLCTASILSLCAISIDRYLAITRPLAYSRRRRSKRLALSMISCVWVAAVVITSPPIFGWYDKNRNTDLQCEYNENSGYVVYSALGSFFLPLLVMLYVYARIACVISQRHKTIEKLHENAQHKKCYEDHGGREDTVARVLDALDDHNKVERSSSSSVSQTIGTPTSPCEQELSLWNRLRCASFPKTSSSSSRSDSQKYSERQQRYVVRSNTLRDTNGGCRHSCRTRTGSRLCHHSISTLSPQRSIHRSKNSSSITAVSLSEGDVSITKGKAEGSYVWTIEGRDVHHHHHHSHAHHHHSSSSSSSNNQSCKPNGRAYGPANCDNGRIIETSVTDVHARIYPAHHHHHSNLHAGGGGGVGHCSGASSTNSLQIHTSNMPGNRRSMRSTVGHTDSNTIPTPTTTTLQVSREFTGGRMASFKRETKTAQTLAAVVGGFIICWLPFFVAYVIGPFIPKESIPGPLMDALIWLGWGNSAINPFIYAFYSPDFRSAFWRLTFQKCECLWRPRPDRSSPRRYDDTNTGMRTSN